MLWKLVDVVVILGAVGLLLLLGPDVIGLKKWKARFAGRVRDHVEEQSQAVQGKDEPEPDSTPS